VRDFPACGRAGHPGRLPCDAPFDKVMPWVPFRTFPTRRTACPANGRRFWEGPPADGRALSRCARQRHAEALKAEFVRCMRNAGTGSALTMGGCPEKRREETSVPIHRSGSGHKHGGPRRSRVRQNLAIPAGVAPIAVRPGRQYSAPPGRTTWRGRAAVAIRISAVPCPSNLTTETTTMTESATASPARAPPSIVAAASTLENRLPVRRVRRRHLTRPSPYPSPSRLRLQRRAGRLHDYVRRSLSGDHRGPRNLELLITDEPGHPRPRV